MLDKKYSGNVHRFCQLKWFVSKHKKYPGHAHAHRTECYKLKGYNRLTSKVRYPEECHFHSGKIQCYKTKLELHVK